MLSTSKQYSHENMLAMFRGFLVISFLVLMIIDLRSTKESIIHSSVFILCQNTSTFLNNTNKAISNKLKYVVLQNISHLLLTESLLEQESKSSTEKFPSVQKKNKAFFIFCRHHWLSKSVCW